MTQVIQSFFFSGGEKKKKTVVGHKKINAINKEQTSQVNNFSTFLYMRKMQGLGLVDIVA